MNPSARAVCVLAAFLAGPDPARAQEAADRDGIDSFERQIRPVLVDRCYSCHSARAAKVKGGLLLDTREGLLKGGAGGPAVVPGDPARSRLIRAVRYADEDLRMPPKSPLTAEQVSAFEEWVRRGAPTTPDGTAKAAAKPATHWAFLPPKTPPVPSVRLASWPKTEVDRFILAKLEGKGLRPAPPADRRTLLRRATFDLLGLPPKPEDIDSFLADDSPDAFAHVVDRLLASPHYGERWGRHWLDVARFSDTKGYVQMPEERRYVHSAAYRDWVVRAFNEDLPYDKFLVLQLAADQLAPSEARQGRVEGAGGDPSSLAALGFLTLGRRFKNIIHDIIDDRIDTVTRATMGLTVGCARCHDHKFDPIPTRDYYSLYGVFAGAVEKAVPLEDGRAAFREELKKREAALRNEFAAVRRRIEERHRKKAREYLAAAVDVDRLPPEETVMVLTPEELNPVVVRRWHAYILRRGPADRVFGPWHAFASSARMDLSRLNPRVAQAFSGTPPASMHEVARRYGELLADPADEELRRVLYGEDSPVVVPSGSVAEAEYFLDWPLREELLKLQGRIDRWILEADGAPPHAVVLEEPAVRPPARVFRRGNPSQKGEEVPCRFLECVSGEPPESFRADRARLDLALSIASAENPLTARVMVNRVWLHHFGEGLVRTPSDFGLRSEAPTHPELLDWLARRFVAEGWSVKKMHRRLMLSSVYRQSCEPPPDTRREDPSNLLWGRANRRRLDFEEMRDALLLASGDLDPALGGRAVDLTGRPFSRRRSVYGLVDRLNLPGLFRVFDFPSPDAHSPRRVGTTTAPQALFLMNGAFVQERARQLARRTEVEREPERRIRALYGRVHGRAPTRDEIAWGLGFVTSLPEPAAPPPPAWQYGSGVFDPAERRLKSFEPLAHFTGSVWHAGPANLLITASFQQPDVKNGFPTLSAGGGHVGVERRAAVARRWVAPRAGKIVIEGNLPVASAWIVSGRGGVLASGKAGSPGAAVEVVEGEAIDFIVDGGASPSAEPFAWSPRVRLTDATGAVQAWDAARDFGGPPPVPLRPWEKYAQALLVSNEFLFVD